LLKNKTRSLDSNGVQIGAQRCAPEWIDPKGRLVLEKLPALLEGDLEEGDGLSQ
jgi:hypothetical protein